MSLKKIIQALVLSALSTICVVACGQGVLDLSGPASTEPARQSNSAIVWPTESELSGIQARFRYRGSIECANCHVAAQAKNILENVEDFVLLSEFQTWLNQDPHARAYLSIIPDRSHFDAVTERRRKLNTAVNQSVRANGSHPQPSSLPGWEAGSNRRSLEILMQVCGSNEAEIGQLFQRMTDQPDFLVADKTAIENPTKLMSTVKLCLSCHAGWDNRQSSFDVEVVKYGTGVSCEGCHGASSEWLANHSNVQWRKLEPAIKQEKFGLVNTRNPLVRAETCFSCHIGDVDQGKVVTHEMYAGGHPPLPGIEIESFSDQIPRHWRYLNEKKEFDFASQFKANVNADLGLKVEPGQSSAGANVEFSRTRNLLVGGVMASAQSVGLLAESAAKFSQVGQNITGGLDAWPEFAVFDCAACHHDLKAAGWQRGFAGVPGRPPAPYWPRTLSRLGVAYLSISQPGNLESEFLAKQRSFQNALDRQPFGKPAELQMAGAEYSRWLENDVARRIQSAPLTREDAIGVIQLLCGQSESPFFQPEDVTWDFHSARQLGWAINLVYSELAQPSMPNYEEFSSQTDALNAALSRSSAFAKAPESDVEMVLQEMRKDLMLDLVPTGEISLQQKRYLDTWRNFDRKRFIDMLARLRQALEKHELSGVDGESDNQTGIQNRQAFFSNTESHQASPSLER